MKVRARENVSVPGHPELKAGEERQVSDELGAALVERGQAEEVRDEKPSDAKPAKKAEAKK